MKILFDVIGKETSMWVFGYGSLMWDSWETKFQGTNQGKARLKGYHRSFNKKSTSNWGTSDAPCPTLGLERSSEAECVGLVFEFNDNQRKSIEAKLKKREGKSFQLVEIEVELESGQKVMALTSINQPKMITYINNTDLNEMIDMAKKTSGNKGSCLEYIQNIYMKCKELGIQDENVQKMWELINSVVPTSEEA